MVARDLVNPKDWQTMAEICERFYIQGEKQKDIAKKLNLSSGQVSRLLNRARELGVVKFCIEEVPGDSWKRLHRLEEELLKYFALERAIVVDFPYDREATGLEDDNLHMALASACATFLQTWLRSKDHIGVGGGRGTFYTADRLRATAADSRQRSLTGIRITSLTGNMTTTPWDSTTTIVDADQAAAVLASAFSGSTFKQLNAPVAPPQGQLERYWETGSARVLKLEIWRNDPYQYVPNVALVGVGALAGEHRFCRQVNHNLDALASLQPELAELLDLIKPSVDRGYYPVGDICNRLFFVRPKTTEPKLNENEEAAIKDYVERLNWKILSVNKDQLRMIRARGILIVIGGGRFKLDAISSLLTCKDGQSLTSNTLGAEISVDILCTDVTTAARLIWRVTGQEDRFKRRVA